MSNLQLEIFNPTIDKPMSPIEWNFEDLKKGLTVALEKYNKITVTEDSVKEGKQDLASLRKLSTTINDKRKEMKKFCLQPYELFEKQVKELDSLIQNPIEKIDTQVKTFEEAKKQAKHDRLKKIFEAEKLEAELEFVDWADVFQPNWDNVTKSEKSIHEEIVERLNGIKQGLETVQSIKSDYSFELVEVYKKTYSVEAAITENNRLIELAERKAVAEAEKAAKVVEPDTVLAQPIPEWNPEPIQNTPTETPTEKTYTVNFAVTGTQEQLQALGQFMRAQNIEFSRI